MITRAALYRALSKLAPDKRFDFLIETACFDRQDAEDFAADYEKNTRLNRKAISKEPSEAYKNMMAKLAALQARSVSE